MISNQSQSLLIRPHGKVSLLYTRMRDLRLPSMKGEQQDPTVFMMSATRPPNTRNDLRIRQKERQDKREYDNSGLCRTIAYQHGHTPSNG